MGKAKLSPGGNKIEENKDGERAKLGPGPWRWASEMKGTTRPRNYDLNWILDANGNRVMTMYAGRLITPNKRMLRSGPELAEALEAVLSADGPRAWAKAIKHARKALKTAGV